MWFALPSPSGNPTTRSLPTSRMISSAIASGSVNSFGIKEAQARLGQPAFLESDAAAGRYSAFAPPFVCDEPATAKHRIQGVPAADGLPVAAAPSKQVNLSRPSAGAAGQGCCGIT